MLATSHLKHEDVKREDTSTNLGNIVENVYSVLTSYAERGIFQNLRMDPHPHGGGKSQRVVSFSFRWLTEQPLLLKLNPVKSTLVLDSVLPGVPTRSAMDKSFRTFLKQRCDKSLPTHRRLDTQRFSYKCSNKNQTLSVTIGFSAGDDIAAAKTAVNLYHEIFNHFLMDGPYQNYMVEHFQISEE